MAIDRTKLKQIHNLLAQNGFAQDYSTFEKKFAGNANYGNRKKVYDLITENGGDIGGSYEDFMKRLQSKPKPKQQSTKPQTTAQRAMQIGGRQLPKPKNVPSNASPFVKSLYAKDLMERGELQPTDYVRKPTDYVSKREDYTSPKAVQNMSRRSQKAGRVAAKNAAAEIDEQYMQSQPVMNTGTPADEYVGKTERQLEKQIADSGADLVNSDNSDKSWIDDMVNNEIFVKAQQRADKAYSEGNWHINPADDQMDELFHTRKSNAEFDQGKMIKSLEETLKTKASEWLSRPETIKKIQGEAQRLGIDVDTYISRSVVPALYNKVSSRLAEKNLDRYMPRSSFDYILGGITEGLTATLGEFANNETKSQKELRKQAVQLTREGKNPHFKPNTWDNAGRGGVAFMSDMPWYTLSGLGATAATEKLFGSAAKQMAVRASQNLAQRVLGDVAKGAVHGYLTGFQFGFVNGAVQNFSTGEDTSLGGTLKAALKGATEEGASFAVMEGMGGLSGALGYKIGLKGTEKGFLQASKRAVQKVGYETVKTGLEGLGMASGGVASSYANHLLTGEDWHGFTKEGTLESCASAVIFKLTHAKEIFKGEKGKDGKRLNFMDGVAQKTSRFFMSDEAKLAPHVFTEDEKAQLFNAGSNIGMKPMDNIISFAKQAKKKKYDVGDDPYKDTDIELIGNAYDQIMADPKVSWDAKAKFTTLVMGTMPESRPMMDYCTFTTEKVGGDDAGVKKYINEYSADGTLLSKTSYDNTDKREQALYKMAMTREGQRLWNVMGTLVGIDKNNYDYQNAFFTERVKDAKDGAEIQAFVDGMGTKGSAVEQEFTNWVLNNGSTMKAIDAFARESGMKKEDIVKLMNKDPLHRTEEEQLLCVKLRRELEKQAFPADKVHEEQSNLEGKDVADDNSLGTEEPKTEAVTEQLDNLSKAEEGVEALMRDNDVFGDNFKKMQDEGMTNPQIYDWMIRNGGMTQEQLKPFADYINANARVQGMQQRTQQKIEEVVGKVVHDWSYRGTMNGVKTDGEQVLYVEDRDGRRLMVGSGDVVFDSVTGRAKEDVGDMLVCLDPETKELVYIKAEDAKFVGAQKPEDFANEYRQKLQEINSQPYNEAMQRQAERDAAKSQQEEVKPEATVSEGSMPKEDNPELYKVADSLQGKIGQSLSKDEADSLVSEMENRAEPARELELTPENWTAEFGEDGKVATPLGEVKMGENQYFKLAKEGRNGKLGLIKPTLEDPDVIIEDASQAKEGQVTERHSSYLFVKAFTGKDGNRVYYFTSVTVSRDGKEVVVSNQERRAKRIATVMESGKILYLKGNQSASVTQNEKPVSLGDSNSSTTTGSQGALHGINSPDLHDKDTNNSSNGNGNEGTLTHSDADYEKNDIPADKDGEPVYEQVPKERTVEDLFGKLGGDGNLAHSFAEAKVAEAEKEQQALLKKEPKMGTKINEYLKKKREYEDAVKAAEAKVAYWNDVKGEIEKLTHTTVDEIKEQQAELDGTAAAAEHKALYGEGQPADGTALAAKFVADAKITPDSFKKETGFGTAEQAGFVGMIAKEENGGKSIERLAEDLVYYDNTEYNGTYFRNDTNEARNAIISALGAARTRKGLRELAQPDLAKFESERAQERDNAYHEAYGMDYEEYLAYSEQEMPHILEKINNFDEEKYLHDKAEEITNQIDKEYGKAIRRDESAGEEPVHGEGDKVLPGTRTDERGGGESPEGHAGRTEAERRSDTENAALPEEASAGRVEEEQQKEVDEAVKSNEGKKTEGETATRERMKVGIGVTYPVKVEDKPVRFEDLKAGDKFLDKNGYDYELKKWAKTDDGKTVAIVYGNGSEFVVSREITGAHDLLDLNDGKFDRIVSYDANPKEPLNPIERTARKEDERYQKGTDAKVPEKREVALRDAVIDRMKNNGMDVTVDHEEGQRVLDMVNDEDVARFQKVYHGSHADFVNFDHSHIGEGEGAQVYGWGTYVTEVKGIGKAYAHTKDGNVQRSIQERKDFIKQRKRDIKQMEDYEKYAKKIMKNRRNSEREWKAAKKAGDEKEMEFYKGLMDIADEQLKPENHAKLIESFHEDIAKAEAKIAELQKSIEGTHHLYTVDIPKDTGENYLDWNEPVTDKQIEGIRKYLSENYRKQKLEAFDASIAEVKDAPNADEVNAWTHRGENIYKTLKTLLGSDKDASMALSEIGLTGIKYPADNMRGGREDGKKNYVVFKEKDAKIIDHVRFFRTSDGKAYGYTLGGKIYIDPRIANTETPIHEYAHLWASALRSGNEKEWQNVVGLMRDTKIWDDVKRLYPELKTDNDIADEVIAQYSGKRGAERLRKMADEVAPGDAMGKLEAHGVIAKVKLALDKFWKGVADMLHIHYTSAEEVADRVMKDLLDGVDPRELSGDKDGELKLSKEEDKKEDKDSSEKLFLSLQQKFNDKKEYYDTVDILSKRLSDGRADLYGLHGETEQATPSVVQAGVEIIARDRGGVSGAEGVRQENDARRNEVERAVEDWAKERGYWKEESQIKESSDGGEMYSKGSEAHVYLSKDKQTITKVVDPYVRSKTELADFMENISVYNTLFPYSAYKVTGVTRRSDGKFSIVMEQPRIVGKQVDLQTYLHDGYFEKVKDYFESLGMEMLDDNISFTNGKYYVSDIHYGNVVFSKDGHPYVIDADAKCHGRFRRNNMDGKPFVVDKENDGLKTDNDKNDTEKLFLSLQNKKGKEYYDTVTELANRVKQGRARTMRLGEEVERKGMESFPLSVFRLLATSNKNLSGAFRSSIETRPDTMEKRESSAENIHTVNLATQKRIIDWAKENGCKFDESDIRKDSLDGKAWNEDGWESTVYRSKDGKSVIKYTPLSTLYNNPTLRYLDRTMCFNHLFPDTAIDVIGFGYDNDGQFSMVTKQPLIEGKTLEKYFNGDNAKIKEFTENFLKELGYTQKTLNEEGYEADSNGKFILFDLNKGNIIIDKEGKPHVIDCEVLPVDYDKINSFEIKDDATQGDTHFRSNVNSVATISEDAPVVVKHVDRVSKETGVKVNMVQSAEEVSSPRVKKALEEGKQVTGWYDEKTGEVHLYMPNIHDRYTAEKTIWHETVGHKGMRGLMGEQFDRFLRDVWYDLDKPENAELKKLVDEERRRNPLNIYDAIEEGIARLAEEGRGEPGFWRNIRNKVTDFFREIGYRIAPNTKDVKYLLWLSKNLQKNPNDVFYKMKAEAVRWRLDHESVPDVIEANGMFFDNDGKAHKSYLDMSKEEYEEATDGEIHLRTTPSAGTAIDRYHRALNEHGYMFTESYMDNMLSLQKLMLAIKPGMKIEDIKSSENPYMLQNTMQGKMSTMAQRFNDDVMEPLNKVMAKALDAFDGKNQAEKTRSFNLYMIAKHGLERNRVFFVRDYIRDLEPSDAEILQRQWDAEKKDLGDKLRNGQIDLKEYYKTMDEWIRNNVDMDYKAGEHDYSGFHGLQEIDDKKAPYDDAEAIQSVMDSEAKMEDIKNDSVADLWSKINTATRYSLDLEYDGSMLTKENHDHVSEMFDWYVPLRKYDEATAEDMYGYVSENGDATTYIGPALMKATGRKSLSNVNVLAQIGAMGNMSISRYGNNAVKMAFARFVRSNGGQGLVTETNLWVEKKGVDNNGKPIWEEAYPKIPENATADEISKIVSDFETDMKAKQAKGEARNLSTRGHIGFKFERAKDRDQHIVDVMIAGKTHRFVVNGNPRAAQALNGLLEHKAGGVGRVFATISRFMAQTCTSYNPEFVMRNMIRDFEFASSNLLAKEGLKYTKVFEKYYAKVGLIEGIRNSKIKDLADTGGFGLYAKYRNGTLDTSNKIQGYFKEFMDNGGETGWVQVKNMKDLSKEYRRNIKTERSKVAKVGKGFYNLIFKNLENVNEIAENMARFATYCASRDSGRSVVRSAYDAKEVSTNFNRHGSASAIKSFKNGEMSGMQNARKQIYRFTSSYFRNTSMFFNAGIQSTNLLIKNFKHNPIGTAGYIAAGPMITAGLMALLNNVMIASEDEKDRKGVKDPYGELPDYIRRNNLCVYIGEGEFVTIPLAIEERAFYGLGDFVAGMTFADNISSQKKANLAENKKVDKWLNPAMDAVGCLSQLVPVMDYLGHTSFGKEPVQETVKGFAPSAISPIVEWLYNSDWKGSPIQRDDKFDEEQPSWMLAYKETPDFLVDINKKVNAATNTVAPGNENMKGNDFWDAVTNPSALQHFYSGYMGGAATFAERAVGLVKKGKDVETKDIPFVRSLLYTPNEQSSLQRTKTKWYNYQDEMAKTMSNVKRLKSKNVPVDQLLRNYSDYFKLQDSKEAMKVQVIEDADKMMKKWKKLRNMSSDTESINYANHNIEMTMQEAVDKLDKLSE